MVFDFEDFEDINFKRKKVYSVSELTAEIKSLLENKFFDTWLEGEISNFKHHYSGHMYFTLKDKDSQIPSVMFKGSNIKLRFKPEDGLKVLVFGRVSVYKPRGSYQFYVQDMEPKGLGELQLAFEQLKKKLESEGLFKKEFKKNIPAFPDVIGVVTSSTGAAIRDIQNVISRRFSLSRILLAPVRVQGNLAPDEIVKAIELFNDYEKVDVLIVGRGGGSIEDLWSFNEEKVARAIFKSKIPVISAVGHEIDFTISDFVADLRAPTPSAAAELVVQDKNELISQLKSFEIRAFNSMKNLLVENKNKLAGLMNRPVFKRASAPIEEKFYRLDDLLHRLVSGMKFIEKNQLEKVIKLKRLLSNLRPDTRIKESFGKVLNLQKNLQAVFKSILNEKDLLLSRLMGKLNVLSPLSVLDRGYSITFKLPENKLVKSIKKINPGDKLKVRVTDGTCECEVLKKTEVNK
ncbi:exodeoxyribonuclease VII large subunit [Candidatus Dependentiae bacterium]|nr:exodeoxyribonuclease VII large subunit [Candidatus Dependentiae bacterium]